MNFAYKKPLDYFKSPEVKSLLEKHLSKNYKLAGVQPSIAKEIIRITWNNKDKDDLNYAKKQIRELQDKAKRSRINEVLEVKPLELINLSKINSFLDIGANNLTTINEVGYTHPEISKLLAIDVVPKQVKEAYPEKTSYYQIRPGENIPVEDESVDVVNYQFVLHHMKDEEEIKNSLKEAYRVLTRAGKLIVWEESFLENSADLETQVVENVSKNIKIDKELTALFNSLTNQQKWEFIIVNDWIINVKHEHMQWSFQYKTWEDWREVLASVGFKEEKIHNLGLRIQGQLKQGVHIIGEFKKSLKF